MPRSRADIGCRCEVKRSFGFRIVRLRRRLQLRNGFIDGVPFTTSYCKHHRQKIADSIFRTSQRNTRPRPVSCRRESPSRLIGKVLLRTRISNDLKIAELCSETNVHLRPDTFENTIRFRRRFLEDQRRIWLIMVGPHLSKSIDQVVVIAVFVHQFSRQLFGFIELLFFEQLLDRVSSLDCPLGKSLLQCRLTISTSVEVRFEIEQLRALWKQPVCRDRLSH